MDPLLGSPCVVQVRSFLEGQVGSEWGYACEGAREPGIRSGEGDMFSAWTLWNSSCPDKITVLLIFLLGILGSKSTRELKNFSFLPKWHHPVWGSAVPLGMWGSILPSSQPLMPWLWPDTPHPPHHPSARHTWPRSRPALGSLGVLPGAWPVPHLGRSAPVGPRWQGPNASLGSDSIHGPLSKMLCDLCQEHGLVCSLCNCFVS